MGEDSVHDSHKGLAPAAQDFRQQDTGHGPDTGEVVQDDEGGNDTRPEAVQRRIGQQHESLEHQRGGVDENTARVDAHPDHAVGIPAITFPLVTRLGDTQQAWIEVSILYAIVSIIMLFICFKNCHERVKEETKTKDGKNVPLWMGIKLCVTNKYFIMFFMLAVFLSFYEAVTGTCNAYYAQYILGNRDLLGALASFESIPQIVTVLVLSPFIAKFGKRNVALIGAIVAVIGTVSLFINPSALNLALFACVMRGIGKGCFRGVKYSMLADVIEYGAWKSGIRVQGLMVSATTAGQKFGSGMTSAIFGALMSLVGFAGTATINAAQSQMLIAIYIIGNIIAWGGIGVLLIFYKLDKIYPRIITEMKQREAAEAAKATANA